MPVSLIEILKHSATLLQPTRSWGKGILMGPHSRESKDSLS